MGIGDDRLNWGDDEGGGEGSPLDATFEAVHAATWTAVAQASVKLRMP